MECYVEDLFYTLHDLGVPDVAHMKELDTIRYVEALGNTLLYRNSLLAGRCIPQMCPYYDLKLGDVVLLKAWQSKHLEDQLRPHWTRP